MARKPEPKPLFDLKSDFYQSLDNFTQQTLNLVSLLDIVLENDTGLKPDLRQILTERVGAVRKAMSQD